MNELKKFHFHHSLILEYRPTQFLFLYMYLFMYVRSATFGSYSLYKCFYAWGKMGRVEAVGCWQLPLGKREFEFIAASYILMLIIEGCAAVHCAEWYYMLIVRRKKIVVNVQLIILIDGYDDILGFYSIIFQLLTIMMMLMMSKLFDWRKCSLLRVTACL